MPKLHIGTSGWSYKDWQGRFYPKDLPAFKQFNYYQKHFKTVEINNTFYHLPKKITVKNWYKKAKKNFIFAIKGSRFITHIKRLKDCKKPLDVFFEVIKHFKNKKGPILWQLPPSFKRDEKRLESFIKLLPKSYKHAFEFRNPEWFRDSVYELLNKYKCAFVIYDMPGLKTPDIITADFAYIRFHGATSLYGTKYTNKFLNEWYKKIKKWKKVKDVYIYFNNDTNAAAIENAQFLKQNT
ncbi:MAG: DUF72 domain-containing protein [Candidatus Margulisbacteria bacterium]|nr:DUF72 domain-containing protein [Candidatus Margulisiibacteriota bacterium]